MTLSLRMIIQRNYFLLLFYFIFILFFLSSCVLEETPWSTCPTADPQSVGQWSLRLAPRIANLNYFSLMLDLFFTSVLRRQYFTKRIISSFQIQVSDTLGSMLFDISAVTGNRGSLGPVFLFNLCFVLFCLFHFVSCLAYLSQKVNKQLWVSSVPN